MKKIVEEKKVARTAGKSITAIARRVAVAFEDRKWDASFARSQDMLKRMGDATLSDYLEGRTEPLDPDTL